MNDTHTKVQVDSINYDNKKLHKTDNFFVTIKFSNGSIAKLNYTSPSAVKEKKRNN